MHSENNWTLKSIEAPASGAESRLCALLREGAPPTVVLLHGAAGNALGFAPLLPALAGRRVLAVDLPGHGESAPATDWSLEAVARELAERIGGELGEPAIWGGHSWGGKLAAWIAGERPELVRGLLLLDPSPASPVPIEPDAFVESAFGGELGPWESLDEAIAAARSLPQYQAWSDTAQAIFVRGLERGADGRFAARARREWLVEIATHALTRDHSVTIARTACPTLLAVADSSLFWQEGTNFAALPAAERAVLPGHHWIHWSSPDAVVGAVGPWLARVAP